MRVVANITLPVESRNQAVKDGSQGKPARNAQHRSPQQMATATPRDQRGGMGRQAVSRGKVQKARGDRQAKARQTREPRSRRRPLRLRP
jgi:hypothetical protein